MGEPTPYHMKRDRTRIGGENVPLLVMIAFGASVILPQSITAGIYYILALFGVAWLVIGAYDYFKHGHMEGIVAGALTLFALITLTGTDITYKAANLIFGLIFGILNVLFIYL